MLTENIFVHESASMAPGMAALGTEVPSHRQVQAPMASLEQGSAEDFKKFYARPQTAFGKEARARSVYAPAVAIPAANAAGNDQTRAATQVIK